MRKLIIICLIALLLSATATRTHAYTTIGAGGFSGSATTIDFEGYTVGTAITTQYAGVTFSSYNGTANPLIDLNETGGGQGLNGGPGDGTIYTYINQDAGVLVTFDAGTTSAGGAYYIDVPPLIGRGLFYDVDGNLIHTFTLGSSIEFWGLSVDPGDALIGSILFDSSGHAGTPGFSGTTSESFTIDNLTYDPTVIPAPSALLLGSMGMGIVSWLRRRKAL